MEVINKDEIAKEFQNKIDKNRSDLSSRYDNNKIETTMMGGIEVSKLSPRSDEN